MQHVTYSYQEWNILVKANQKMWKMNSQQIDTLKSVNNSIHNDHNAIVEI